MMGTFQGHALPGVFFLSFGIWWTYQMASQLAARVRRRKPGQQEAHLSSDQAFLISVTDLSSACTGGVSRTLCDHLRSVPVESVLKIIASCVGVCGELYSAFPHGRFQFVGDLQHATVYLAFALAGVADILRYYQLVTSIPLDYLAIVAAFSSEAILFAFHIEHLDGLARCLHLILVWVVVALALATLLEMLMSGVEPQGGNPKTGQSSRMFSSSNLKQKLLLRYSRIYFTLLQGSWFLQIAFLLYSPLSDDSPSGTTSRYIGPVEVFVPKPPTRWFNSSRTEDIGMWCSLFFIWHCIGVAMAMISLSAVIYYLTTFCMPQSVQDSAGNDPTNAGSFLMQDSKDEEDANSKSRHNLFTYEKFSDCTG